MLIYPKQSAINVADFLSKRVTGKTTSLSELDESALKESANIISGSFLTAISNYLSVNMIESPPELLNGPLKEVVTKIVARFGEKELAESIAMEINFSMSSGEGKAVEIAPELKTSGYFILLLDVVSASKVMNSLKGISGGQTMTQAK